MDQPQLTVISPQRRDVRQNLDPSRGRTPPPPPWDDHFYKGQILTKIFRMIKIYIEVLHPEELRTWCHSSLVRVPLPSLSARVNIRRTC